MDWDNCKTADQTPYPRQSWGCDSLLPVRQRLRSLLGQLFANHLQRQSRRDILPFWSRRLHWLLFHVRRKCRWSSCPDALPHRTSAHVSIMDIWILAKCKNTANWVCPSMELSRIGDTGEATTCGTQWIFWTKNSPTPKKWWKTYTEWMPTLSSPFGQLSDHIPNPITSWIKGTCSSTSAHGPNPVPRSGLPIWTIHPVPACTMPTIRKHATSIGSTWTRTYVLWV